MDFISLHNISRNQIIFLWSNLFLAFGEVYEMLTEIAKSGKLILNLDGFFNNTVRGYCLSSYGYGKPSSMLET